VHGCPCGQAEAGTDQPRDANCALQGGRLEPRPTRGSLRAHSQGMWHNAMRLRHRACNFAKCRNRNNSGVPCPIATARQACRERGGERESDRARERQRERAREREREYARERSRSLESERARERHSDRATERESERAREGVCERARQRESERGRERQRERGRQREREKARERESDRARELFLFCF
jgi:putative hemolysin